MNIGEVRAWATFAAVIVTLGLVAYAVLFADDSNDQAPAWSATATEEASLESERDGKLQETCVQMRQKALTDAKMSKEEKSDLNSQIFRHCD